MSDRPRKKQRPPEDLLRNVGRRIAEVRSMRMLTQVEVAERLGIALRCYQRIESGRANLTLRTLGRVAEELSTTVDRFLHRLE